MFRPPRAIQIETTGNESPATMFTGSIKRYAENTQSITQDPEYFFYLSSAAQSPKRAIPILRLYQGVFADWFTFRHISEHFLSPG